MAVHMADWGQHESDCLLAESFLSVWLAVQRNAGQAWATSG
jgi:hypothetical protein